MIFSNRKLIAFAASFWLVYASLAAQNNNEPERKKKDQPTLGEGSASQRSQRKDPVKFRAEVDQVVIHAAVYDKTGQMVSGLTKEHFKIFENKVQQQITYFGQDDVPSTLGVVLDTSGSMRNKMDLVNEATRMFLEMSHPENELFLVRFNQEVELEEDLTRDVEDIRDALDNLIISGGTAFYDAIFLAVDQAAEGSEPRKAVIVFTDGEDKDSYYKYEELLDKIRESDVQVHIVAFLDPELASSGGFFGIFKSERDKVKQKVNDIAAITGGKAFFPEDTEQLKGAFQAIAQELRNQYRLAYISSHTTKDGGWRDIDVEILEAKEKGLKIRAKKGYVAK